MSSDTALTGMLLLLLLLLLVVSVTGMVCVTMRPKDDADAGAGPVAGPRTAVITNSGSDALGDQRTQRLNSFKRLLSRARGDASSSSDQQQQTTESVPLKHEEGSTHVHDSTLGSKEDLRVDLSSQRLLEQRQVWMQEPAGADASAEHYALHQQQQHWDQVVLIAGPTLPVQVAETSHSIHHRHPLQPPDHAVRQTVTQQQQLGHPSSVQPAGYAGVMLPLQPEPASGPS